MFGAFHSVLVYLICRLNYYGDDIRCICAEQQILHKFSVNIQSQRDPLCCSTRTYGAFLHIPGRSLCVTYTTLPPRNLKFPLLCLHFLSECCFLVAFHVTVVTFNYVNSHFINIQREMLLILR